MTGKFKFIMFNLNQEMQMIIFIGPREEINQKFFIGIESYKGNNQLPMQKKIPLLWDLKEVMVNSLTPNLLGWLIPRTQTYDLLF